MYTPRMKRLQIYIDQDLDAELDLRARRERRSKAAIIRDAVRRAILPVAGPPTADSLDAWIGGSAGETGDIDALLYDR